MACTGVVIGYVLADVTDAGLTPRQRVIADIMVNVLEHDSPVPRYDFVEDRRDGRGWSLGRGSFSTAGGEARVVLDDYTTQVPESPLGRFMGALGKRPVPGDASHTGLEGLDSAWKVAATDYRLQAAQDRAMNRLFFEPAERRADVLGVRSPLGVVILYDSALQHGTGDGVDELGDLIHRAQDRAGGVPRTGVDEIQWLNAFLDVRRAALLSPRRTERLDAWAASVGRVSALKSLLTDSNTELEAAFHAQRIRHPSCDQAPIKATLGWL